MQTIDPMMTFGQVVCSYENYIDDMRKSGKEPVSFLKYITGRY